MTNKVLTPVRTRIAPSPTGFLHLGTARTALYSWAYARHFGGEFVLRIEDTVVEEMIAAGTAYRCYASPEELDAMREAQRARGEKTHYDGRWRPAPGKVLPAVPEGVKPVVRFANPPHGHVAWDDLVKGHISISNEEIDDLIILRPDGVPTYNFAVVVDDWDMAITHVFRGDEHINNTPWQINIFRALSAPLPRFGHCPIILGDDGLKLSKRRGAVSVTAYEDAGYLPEALLNYLARLGWSHGDDELFTREQMVQWFDGSHLAKSPAQWDPAKLAWVNASYMKAADDMRLALLTQAQLARRGIVAGDLDLLQRASVLFKDRCATVVELADWVDLIYTPIAPQAADLAAHVTDAVKPAVAALCERLVTLAWDKASIAAAIKETLAAHQLKMPQLAPALRVLLCGRVQTPSIDAVLALFPRDIVLQRLRKA